MSTHESNDSAGLKRATLQQALFSVVGAAIGAGVLGWLIGTRGIDGDLRLLLEIAYLVGVLPGLIFSLLRLRSERAATHPPDTPGR